MAGLVALGVGRAHIGAKKGRVGNNQPVRSAHKGINIALVQGDAPGKGAGGHIILGLGAGITVEFHRIEGQGLPALGQHQRHQPAAGADIQHRPLLRQCRP